MKLEPGVLVTPNVQLLRPLGEGGMGAVWVAEHKGLGTEVAVKFLLGEYANDPIARARFSQEAAAASQVKSAHVVKMYDYGLTDGGVPFIVMELLEGTDLSERIASEICLAPSVVVAIVSQLAKALERAHEKGVIHRDIKPENIFLTSEGGEIFVKLLDFGIAKTETITKKTTGSRRSTMAGETLGTPYYMSPEQFKSSKTIDARSDLYSVGIVAYEALTGTLPFVAETVSALAIAVNEGGAAPPSTVGPSLPASIDAWFAKACARDPDQRFHSARELSDSLRLALGMSLESRDAVSSASGPYRHVVLSRPDGVDMGLGDTAFAQSGSHSQVKPKPTSRRNTLVAASAAALVVAGGALLWRPWSETPKTTVLSSPTSSAVGPRASEPIAAPEPAPPAAASSVSVVAAPSGSSAPHAPTPPDVRPTRPQLAAKPAQAPPSSPSSSAPPRGGTQRRDIW